MVPALTLTGPGSLCKRLHVSLHIFAPKQTLACTLKHFLPEATGSVCLYTLSVRRRM